MSIEIKHRFNGSVLYTAENAQDVRQALEEAVKADANLGYANLRSADLRYANLGYANLRSADLRSANLRSANLRSADLRSADLRYANLRSADLESANLRSANLGSANLRSADLESANLGSADLGYADLRSANLRSANLGYANLRYANLGYANLRSLLPWNHPLWANQADLFSILDQATAEVPGVLAEMEQGNINGSVYGDGKCGCLMGTIGKVHCDGEASRETEWLAAVDDLGIVTDASRPGENWFIPISKGDKPIPFEKWPDREKGEEWASEGVFRISVAYAWIRDWVEIRTAIAAALTAKQA